MAVGHEEAVTSFLRIPVSSPARCAERDGLLDFRDRASAGQSVVMASFIYLFFLQSWSVHTPPGAWGGGSWETLVVQEAEIWPLEADSPGSVVLRASRAGVSGPQEQGRLVPPRQRASRRPPVPWPQHSGITQGSPGTLVLAPSPGPRAGACH